MNKLTFKTFTWPQNPETLEHKYVRDLVYVRDSLGNQVIYSAGSKKCTITGKGTFSGEGAYEAFQALQLLFEETTSGTLTDPKLGELTVYLTELEITREPRENSISYRFQFTRA